ncbi:MAG: sigma-70 family RNA polymerase sigma factor [Chloroflexi bacterium]|nr:sigma-70 family RNA polymerase sigma factor [Chloroflexota bacterium]
MPTPGPDDIARKRAAVATLYETHYERVVRYVHVRIGDHAEAEDLASEVFTRALRAADTFEETGAPMEAWIFKMAHNIVVDHFRKKGRRPAAVPLEDAGSVASDDDPAAAALREQDYVQLRKAMQNLTEAQRQVLSLRFGGGLKSEEAARVMGKKPGAVREMQHAAVLKLKRILEEQQG